MNPTDLASSAADTPARAEWIKPEVTTLDLETAQLTAPIEG